jgi:flagellar motor switch protein FliN/FliY
MTLESGYQAFTESFTQALAQVLESMADARPECRWTEGAEPPALMAEDLLWWAQPFSVDPAPLVWVGAPAAAWADLGGRTLRAAGLDEVDSEHARNTWLEILGQALSVLGRSLSQAFGHEVTCGTGAADQAPPAGVTWHSITLSYPDAVSTLLLGFAPTLAGLLAEGPRDASGQAAASLGPADGQPPAPAAQDLPAEGNWPRTMHLLLDVELPVSISFGKAELPMRDVLKLTTGSIVELNRALNEPVEVLVNQCLIARGEVVVVDGNYGVRIQQIVSPQDRLRSIR